MSKTKVKRMVRVERSWDSRMTALVKYYGKIPTKDLLRLIHRSKPHPYLGGYLTFKRADDELDLTPQEIRVKRIWQMMQRHDGVSDAHRDRIDRAYQERYISEGYPPVPTWRELQQKEEDDGLCWLRTVAQLDDDTPVYIVIDKLMEMGVIQG